MEYLNFAMIRRQNIILLHLMHIMIYGDAVSIYASSNVNILETKDCMTKNNHTNNHTNNCMTKNNPQNQQIQCPVQKTKSFQTNRKTDALLTLDDIESTDCRLKNVNENLFFIESSGRNHLRPRDACAIESALLRNAGMSMYVIVGMTSPILDVLANNATCQLYTKYAAKNLFFRHINVDTIFKGTPLNQFHISGRLMNKETKYTTYQYR